MEFDIASVEQIRKHLVEVPPFTPTKVSRAEAVRLLAPEIAEMQSKGYSLGKVAAFLSDKGLPISAGVVKTCLRDVRSANGPRVRKAKDAGVRSRARRATGAASGAATDAQGRARRNVQTIAPEGPGGMARTIAPSSPGSGPTAADVLDAEARKSDGRKENGVQASRRDAVRGRTAEPGAGSGAEDPRGAAKESPHETARSGASRVGPPAAQSSGSESGLGGGGGGEPNGKGSGKGSAAAPSWSFQPREDSEEL